MRGRSATTNIFPRKKYVNISVAFLATSKKSVESGNMIKIENDAEHQKTKLTEINELRKTINIIAYFQAHHSSHTIHTHTLHYFHKVRQINFGVRKGVKNCI